jgi:hypothetical protein
MIVAKNVKRAVDYKPQQLLSSRYALGFGIFPCDLGADIDVPNYGAAPANPAEAERYHVGRTVVPEVAMVQMRYRGPPDERNR